MDQEQYQQLLSAYAAQNGLTEDVVAELDQELKSLSVEERDYAIQQMYESLENFDKGEEPQEDESEDYQEAKNGISFEDALPKPYKFADYIQDNSKRFLTMKDRVSEYGKKPKKSKDVNNTQNAIDEQTRQEYEDARSNYEKQMESKQLQTWLKPVTPRPVQAIPTASLDSKGKVKPVEIDYSMPEEPGFFDKLLDKFRLNNGQDKTSYNPANAYSLLNAYQPTPNFLPQSQYRIGKKFIPSDAQAMNQLEKAFNAQMNSLGSSTIEQAVKANAYANFYDQVNKIASQTDTRKQIINSDYSNREAEVFNQNQQQNNGYRMQYLDTLKRQDAAKNDVVLNALDSDFTNRQQQQQYEATQNFLNKMYPNVDFNSQIGDFEYVIDKNALRRPILRKR